MSRENILKMSELRSRDGVDDSSSSSRRFHYIKGSVHQNHIDSPFVFSVSIFYHSTYHVIDLILIPL